MFLIHLLLKKVSAAFMQVLFPLLTSPEFLSHPEIDLAVPPGPFSGGSASL